MFTRWTFRIMLLAMGVAGLVGWLAEFVDYQDLMVDGKPALLEQASKASPPGPPVLLDDVIKHNFQVKFRTESGQQIVVERYVPKEIVDRMLKGERVEIVYARDNPPRFIYKGERLPTGIAWLAFGIAMVGLFALSLRLS